MIDLSSKFFAGYFRLISPHLLAKFINRYFCFVKAQKFFYSKVFIILKVKCRSVFFPNKLSFIRLNKQII